MKKGQDQRFVWSCFCFKEKSHPGRLTWNLQITHLERKMIFPGRLTWTIIMEVCFRSFSFLNGVMAVGSQPFIFTLWGSCRRKTSRTSCRHKDLISRPWCMRVLNCFSDGWNWVAVILVLMFLFFFFALKINFCKVLATIQSFFLSLPVMFLCYPGFLTGANKRQKIIWRVLGVVRKWAADTPELWFGWCVISCSLSPSWPQTLLQNQRSWCFVLINLDINVLISRAVGNLIFSKPGQIWKMHVNWSNPELN